jgi:hypothetical protein
MTLEEAIKTMRNGIKVTHRYFSVEEWVTGTENGNLQFEDGVVCSLSMFLLDRSGDSWKEGWSVWDHN